MYIYTYIILFDICLVKNKGEREGKMKKWSEKRGGIRTEELPEKFHEIFKDDAQMLKILEKLNNIIDLYIPVLLLL